MGGGSKTADEAVGTGRLSGVGGMSGSVGEKRRVWRSAANVEEPLIKRKGRVERRSGGGGGGLRGVDETDRVEMTGVE